MRKMWKFLRAEHGQATVLVAVALIALLGFIALTVDIGNVYLEKSKLQKALDAAVLGGAQVLMEYTEDDVEEIAAKISERNGFPLDDDTDVEASRVEYYVKATKQHEVGMFFAKALGIKTMTIEAKAKAVIRPISGLIGVIPVGVAKDKLPSQPEGKTITIIYDDKIEPGNVGYLDLDGEHDGGTNKLAEQIMYGYQDMVSIHDLIYPETGNPKKPLDAFEWRFEQDAGIEKCENYKTADKTCKRLVYVPIIPTWDGVNGQSEPVEVIGFAVIFLHDIEAGKNGKKKTVTGTFVKEITQGEMEEEFDPNKDFGLYGVKLTE